MKSPKLGNGNFWKFRSKTDHNKHNNQKERKKKHGRKKNGAPLYCKVLVFDTPLSHINSLVWLLFQLFQTFFFFFFLKKKKQRLAQKSFIDEILSPVSFFVCQLDCHSSFFVPNRKGSKFFDLCDSLVLKDLQ